MTIYEPKVGNKLFLPESLVFTCVISFLVSLLFGALVDPFDPFNAKLSNQGVELPQHLFFHL